MNYLKLKRKEWMTLSQDNVLVDLQTADLVSCHYKNPAEHIDQVQSKDNHHHNLIKQ